MHTFGTKVKLAACAPRTLKMRLLLHLRCDYCIRSLANVRFTHWPIHQLSLPPSPLTRLATTSADKILLYRNTQSQTKFFRLIFIMSGVQLVFWVYLSYFAFVELSQETLCRQADKTAVKHSSSAKHETALTESYQEEDVTTKQTGGPWYSSLRWRLAISLLALGMGVFFATTACMYPLRVVQKMSYVRGKGGGLHITTYSPFRGTRVVCADLSAIGMAGSRVTEGKGRQLGMKVKGHRLFYLLDREGEFPSPTLFDTLIGARKL